MFFPNLTKRTVQITDSRGRVHSVRMLPVRFFDDYIEALKKTWRNPTPDGFVEGRETLRILIMNVWPAELEKELFRFDFQTMSKVCEYLVFGTDKADEAAALKKKDEVKKELDFEFIAARILHIFPGYTLETLLDEPVMIFFELLKLASRIQADDALSIQIPAIAAALNGGDMAKALNTQRGDVVTTIFGDSEIKESYTQQELDDAIKRMHMPQKILKIESLGSLKQY